MADEIEKYLLAKLTDAIKEAESTEQYLSAKLFSLHFQFKQLKVWLESNTSPSLAADGSKRKEKLYHLNNVLTEWQMLSKKQSSYSPEALSSAYDLNRRLKRIKRELRGGDVSGAGAPPDGSRSPQLTGEENSSRNIETYRWSCRFVDETKVHGLDEKAMLMERLLVRQRQSDDPFKAIGIVGMGGIGKTTLCQLIFNRQRVKDYFLPRIWVCMSKQPKEDTDNRKEIVKRMLMRLGVEEEIIKSADESHGLPGLLFALRLQLMGKRYLIVLDDAWSSDKCYENLGSDGLTENQRWGEQLAYGLPKGYGGTVIVTSRKEEIARNMVGEENLHPLFPLSDPDSCWLIFKDSVEKDGAQFPADLEDLKDIIVSKCAGLPLAAQMMGKIMQEQLQENKDGTENRQESQQPTC